MVLQLCVVACRGIDGRDFRLRNYQFAVVCRSLFQLIV
jgi:hypothetical protein